MAHWRTWSHLGQGHAARLHHTPAPGTRVRRTAPGMTRSVRRRPGSLALAAAQTVVVAENRLLTGNAVFIDSDHFLAVPN